MAEFVFTNPYLTINAVDLADHVRSASLSYSAEMRDITAGGDDTRNRLGGLKDWSMEIDFNQDFAAGKVDATLFGLVGTTFTVALRATNAAKSATNPEFTGTGILETYPPIGGAVGDEATVSITIQAAGTLSRATS